MIVKNSPAFPEAERSSRIDPDQGNYDMHVLSGRQKRWIEIRAAFYIFRIAMRNYKSVWQSAKAVRSLYLFKKSVLGGIESKIVQVGRKYFHSIYAPGFPSKAFDRYIEGELNRISPIKKKANILSFIFFAITSKCPLKCEHCFEWNNLNKPETFSFQELKKVVDKFQEEGTAQFHLSGGEPMVRIKDLEHLVAYGSKDSEFYVLTSGFNFTAANARLLKQAGLTGVVISLDHFDPVIHNAFRGSKNSFEEVMKAIRNAQEQHLVTVLSICTTRLFVSRENLVKYAELAKKLNVSFIQILEPKAIGRYEGKEVCLDETHFAVLEEFYHALNFGRDYKDYPVIVYHGYHLRRLGCLSGGNRALYIDSEGFVNSCPFCRTKSFNIKDVIRFRSNIPDALQSMSCERYKKVSNIL